MLNARRLLLTALICAWLGCGGIAAELPSIETPPGADERAAALVGKLARALADKDKAYRPRTQHLREDGSPEYTNRLILESSPYLLQHAHNPVDWYPWGDEAFETAKRLGRPVLLSIGYSTCHWCHVMEEESFEDEEIAAYMNAHYVAIKVDREERPDLDEIYMTAVQSLTGSGGWPMTTWLTPKGEPFYGGTYFPPRTGVRGSRMGFLSLLQQLKSQYDLQPAKIANQARELRLRIQSRLKAEPGTRLPRADAMESAAVNFRNQFDRENGGVRRSRKFPSSLPIRFVLRNHRRKGNPVDLEMAVVTLTKMANGGIHDVLAGGFHRYTVDPRWLVPHFEKMLYDNALLVPAYLEGYQVTGREEFAEVARGVLRYVAREMTAPGGAFYSATDADSPGPDGEREEGWFFTWTPAEIRAVVGADRARAFEAYYNVTERGNFEHRNIPNVTRSLKDVAAELGLQPKKLQAVLSDARDKLYRERLKRPPPLLDDKILTSWNGLMISAFVRGGFVLDEPEFVERGAAAADFLLKHLRKNGRLSRSYREGRARHNGYLDDYAFLGAGLLDLYEVTGEARWLREAIALQATLDKHHGDAKYGGYFLTSDDHEKLLAREKSARDGAEPSGNSVALMNLLRLHELTTDDRYRETSEALLRAFASPIRGAPEMLLALDFHLDRAKEIVIVTPGSRTGADPFLDALRTTFLPNRVVAVVSQKEAGKLADLMPLVKGKVARAGKTTAYVCEQGVCKLPTTDVEVFLEQILARPEASGPES